MSRSVSATVTDSTRVPREGLRIDFYGSDGSHVVALTDAGGIFTAELVPGITYDIPAENPAYVAGVPFPAGVMFRVTIPEGDGPVSIIESQPQIIDMSRSAIARRLDALELAAGIVAPAPIPAPVPQPEPEPQAPEVVTI